MNKEDIKKILKEIGFADSEVSVYIALLDGFQSVKEIMKITSEKRPTVYYSLNSLEKRGLVSKTGKDYGNKFHLEPIDKLIEFINLNIRKQNIILEKVIKIKDFYPKNKKENNALISYFDNLDSIKSTIFYTLYSRSKIIKSIVPANNFFIENGESFIKDYVNQKKVRGIKTKAIWEDIPKKSVIKEYYNSSDIRQFPVDMHNSFDTTIFIYDDKTLYIGPVKENYAVLIQSKSHSNMMNTLFDNLWLNSIDVLI